MILMIIPGVWFFYFHFYALFSLCSQDLKYRLPDIKLDTSKQQFKCKKRDSGLYEQNKCL